MSDSMLLKCPRSVEHPRPLTVLYLSLRTESTTITNYHIVSYHLSTPEMRTNPIWQVLFSVACGACKNVEDLHRKRDVMAQDRAGWKGGRFSVDFETSSIYGGLR